jgi:hypothetical protein
VLEETMLEIIKNDLFGISKRLKSINPKYVVFRETATGRVEVHNSTRPCARSLQFIVPYDYLDERTLEYAWETRIENFDQIEQQQTKANAEITAAAKKKAEQTAHCLGDMLKYATNQVHGVTFKKNKRWF